MLKMRVSIDSDSILDAMTVAENMMQEAHEHGLDVLNITTNHHTQTDWYAWSMEFLIMDDEAQGVADEQLHLAEHEARILRVKELAENAAKRFKKPAVDDMPF